MGRSLTFNDNHYYLVHIGSSSDKHPIFRSVFAYNAFLKHFKQHQQQHQLSSLAYALFANEVILLAKTYAPIEHWVDAWTLEYSRWSHRVHEHQGSVFTTTFNAVEVLPDVLDWAILYVHASAHIKGLFPDHQYPENSHNAYAKFDTNTLTTATMNTATVATSNIIKLSDLDNKENETGRILPVDDTQYDRQPYEWLDIRAGLKAFHFNPQQAKLRYQKRMNTPLNQETKKRLEESARYGNHPTLSRWDKHSSLESKKQTFTNEMTGEDNDKPQHPFHNICEFDPKLDQLVLFIQKHLEVPAEALWGLKRHRRSTDARAIIAWLAMHEAIPKSAIEQYFQTEWPLLQGQMNSTQRRMGANACDRLLYRWQHAKSTKIQ